jgi:tetratricopeptide (TPR) repeat protein
MATASKRVTRKNLRQPDWFQTNSEKAVDYFEHHKALVFGALGTAVLVALALWSWQTFKERQNVTAGLEFNKAVELYQGTKYAEALAAFEKVQGYRWSRYAGLAHLYQANIHLAKSDLNKALTSAQRAVSATQPNSLYRQLALMALASAEERLNQCKTAIEHYSEAQRIAGAVQADALLGKARCAEQLGDKSLMIASYKEYVKENPASPLTIKLSELETAEIPKSAPAPAKNQ